MEPSRPAASAGASGQKRQRPTLDLANGPLGPTMLILMLPILAQNFLQTLNGSASVFWVSYALGERGLAAVTIGAQVMFLMIGLLFGVSIASSILIGQAIGSRDPVQVKTVAGSCTTYFVLVSTAIGALGACFTPAMIDLLGTPDAARADAITYLRIIFVSTPFLFFASYLMMAQRGAGDARTPFVFALLQITLDVILNPFLIIGIGPFPGLGIAGSAAASLISQAIALIAMMIFLYRKSSPVVLRRGEFAYLKPDRQVFASLSLKGTAMGLQMIVGSLGAAAMIGAVNRWGLITTSAYGAAMQLSLYVQMPAIALGAAVSVIAAQSIGAGRIDRVGQAARIAAVYSVGITCAMIVLVLIAERALLGMFLSDDSPALPIAVHLNRIILWSFVGSGLAMTLFGAFRATGAVWPPLMFLIVSLFVVRLPFAFGLAPQWGPDAIWFSFPLGAAVMAALALGYFYFGRWREGTMMATGAGGPPGRVSADAIAQDDSATSVEPVREPPTMKRLPNSLPD